MNDDETKKRLDLLLGAVIRKVNKEENSHEELFKAIEDDAIASIDFWLMISDPTKCATAETKAFIEQIRLSISVGTLEYLKNQKNKS